MIKKHNDKIKIISTFLKNRKSKSPLDIYKEKISHQVPGKEKKNIDKLDISNLNEIISIDFKKKVCVTEPGVTISNIVKEALKYNLTPIVVPELKDITVGGAIVGCSLESQSYRYGGFHDNCLEYEFIDSKGEVIICSPSNRKELFHMIHGTFGTLGVLTKVTFRLVDAKKYVHVKYENYTSIEEYMRAIRKHYKSKENTFVDGLIFAKDKFTLALGNYVDDCPYLNDYKQKLFFKSVEEKNEDYMTLYDYYYRYDADCHWVTRNYGLTNPVLRTIFGRFFLGSTKLLKLSQKLKMILKLKKPEIIVDLFLPENKFISFYKEFEKKYNYYPIWIVPYKIKEKYPWVSNKYNSKNTNLLIDFAIYGMKQLKGENTYRQIEKLIAKYYGIKTLISFNYYSKNEFWDIWNKTNYYNIKNKTDPENIFQDIYEKMVGN